MRDYRIWIMFLMFFSACSNQKETKDYVNFIRSMDSGLVKVKKSEKMNVQIEYQPKEFLVLNNSEAISQDELENATKELQGIQHFNLKLSSLNAGENVMYMDIRSNQEAEDRSNYLHFKMEKDIYLVQGGDTIPPLFYHFEKSYGLKPETTILLAFEENESSNRTVVIDSPVISKAPLKFTIEQKKIDKLPKLKI